MTFVTVGKILLPPELAEDQRTLGERAEAPSRANLLLTIVTEVELVLPSRDEEGGRHRPISRIGIALNRGRGRRGRFLKSRTRIARQTTAPQQQPDLGSRC